MKRQEFEQVLTVAQLREALEDWPDETASGEPAEVWILTAPGLSSGVRAVCPLNCRRAGENERWRADLLLEPEG